MAVTPVAKWIGTSWQLAWDCSECGKLSHPENSETTFAKLSADIGPWSLAQNLPGAPFQLV